MSAGTQRLTINGGFQRGELELIAARWPWLGLTVRRTYVDVPTDMLGNLSDAVGTLQDEARNAGQRGRCNALGSIARHVVKAREAVAA